MRACVLWLCWLWSRILLLQTSVQGINFKFMCISMFSEMPLMLWTKCVPVLWEDGNQGRSSRVAVWPCQGQHWCWQPNAGGTGGTQLLSPQTALPEVRSHCRRWSTLSLHCLRWSRKEENVADSNMTVSSNNEKPQQCAHTGKEPHTQSVVQCRGACLRLD